MFEPVSGEEEDTDFKEQPIVRRLEMEAIEWQVFVYFFCNNPQNLTTTSIVEPKPKR